MKSTLRSSEGLLACFNMAFLSVCSAANLLLLGPFEQ